MPASRFRRAAVVIVLVALGVRLAAGAWWQSRLPPGQRFFFGDSESYWELGQRLAQGQSYQFRSAERRVFARRVIRWCWPPCFALREPMRRCSGAARSARCSARLPWRW